METPERMTPDPSRIVEAEPVDVADVMRILSLCVAQMRAQGIHQWDEIYPNQRVVAEDVRARSLWVIRQDGHCVAAICLNEVQPEEYREVPWRCRDGRVLVIHRLCVHPDWQAHGLARQLMEFAENHARVCGFSSIRLDAYTGNPRAIALYERRGYLRVGQANFPRRPLPFDLFEKEVSSRSDATPYDSCS
jgi:ribosomal protein S18 acetylase RimI-like enzyme